MNDEGDGAISGIMHQTLIMVMWTKMVGDFIDIEVELCLSI
jgi:hypothetical protein